MIHADRLGQRLTCADGALVRAGKVRVALGQRVLRVLERQLYKLVLRAALRLKHRDLRALPLGERQRDVFRLFGQLHAEDFGGRLSAVVVKLHDERAENLRRALVARAIERVILRADHVTAAHIDDLHHRVNMIARAGDDILIAAVDVDRLLPLHQVLRVADSVAELGGLFKAHFTRGLVHLLSQPVDDRVGFAAQKVDDLLYRLAVFLRGGQRRARRKAFAELVVQARALVHAGLDRHGAGAQRKQPAQHVEHLPHARRAHIRAKILSLILLHAAHQLHARIILCEIDFQIRIMLIILQKDVILRLMQLDQVAFQNQRFEVRIAEHDIKIIDPGDHRAHLDRVRLGVGKILADAVFKVDRLADVDDFPLAFHQVATRTGRQFFNFEFQQIVHGMLPSGYFRGAALNPPAGN